MSDHGLGTAGIASATIGASAASADMMGWLNTNSEGMGALVGGILALFTISFYIASIYLRRQERDLRKEAILDEISKEFYSKLDELEYSEETKSDAIEIVCKLLDRRKDN